MERLNMTKLNIKRLQVALFMIFLIVTLPVYSSVTLAASINPPVKMYGEDGITGFRSPSDTTTVEVSVTHPEDPDIGGQVKVLEEPTRRFECSLFDEATVTSVCSNTYPTTDLPENIDFIELTLQVFNDANEPMSAPVKGSILVDHQAPQVESIHYVPQDSGLVEAEYVVSDTACSSPQCANKCSGFESILFKVGEQEIGGVHNATSACQASGTAELTGIVGPGSYQTKHICIELTDRLGLTDTECRDVAIDAKPPEVTGISLIDSQGRPVKYSNGQPMGNVRLALNITEHSQLVNPDNIEQVNPVIKINASDLTERPDQKAQFGEVLASCVSAGEDEYACQSSGLFLIMTSARSINLDIEAADEFGNRFSGTRPIDISFDSTPPQATGFSTDWSDDRGQYWLNDSGNNIYLGITETGSGLSKRDVYLDISGLGPQQGLSGTGVLKANKCEPGWTCSWSNLDNSKSDGSSLTISTKAGSKDDAGNELPVFQGVLFTDKSGPEIIELTIDSMGPEGRINYSYIEGPLVESSETPQVGSGDSLQVHAYVEDYTPVSAFANFSRMIGEMGYGDMEGSCSEFSTTDENLSVYINSLRKDESKRLWDCYWETPAIISVPYDIENPWQNTSVDLSFDDLLAHRTGYEQDIQILGRENVTADYWEFEWESSSPTLDRFAWGLGQPQSFQHIKVTPKHSDVRMISFDLDSSSCSGMIDYLFYTETGSAGVEIQGFDPDISDGIDDMVLIDLNPANAPPATITNMENETVVLNMINITCPASIVSVVGEARVSTVEEENLTFFMEVKSNPLGENIGNVQEQIDEWEDKLENKWWKVVKYPKMVFQYAQMACTIVNMLNQVRAIFTVFAGGLGAACKSTGYFCSGSSVANQQVGQQKVKLKGLLGEISQFCGLVISCRATKPQNIDGATNKGTKENPDWECKDDSIWCKVQLGWSQLNNFWVKHLSGASLMGTETMGGMPESGSSQLALAKDDKGRNIGGKDVRFTGENSLPLADQQALKDNFDVKKSLISSVLTACLPGIFSGIDKYKQVACQRLMCYKVNVAYGTSMIDECDDLYRYSVCKYVAADVWNLVPMYQYVNSLMKMIRDVIQNPTLLVGYVFDAVCTQYCTSGEPGTMCSVCTGIEFLNVGAQLAANVVGIKDMWEARKDQDICKEALKDEPQYSNLPGWPKEEDPAETAPEATEEMMPESAEE